MSYGSSIILFSLSTPSYTDPKVRKLARGFSLPFQIFQLLSRRRYRIATPTLIGCETIMTSGPWGRGELAGSTRARLPVSVVVNASPVMPCMWTLAFWHNENRTPTHGAERARPQGAIRQEWRRE